VNFTSKFEAPVDRVWEAFNQPERLKEFVPENVLKSDVVSQDGNKKTIDLVARLDILPPGFKVQKRRTTPSSRAATARPPSFASSRRARTRRR
jgi:hypothetical protein